MRVTVRLGEPFWRQVSAREVTLELPAGATVGLRLAKDEIQEAGRRVIDLERWLNLQFGRTRADDTLPKRYFDDPMPARATKGHRIERPKFEAMLDEYYRAREWDEQGRLSPKRAAELESYLR